MLRDGLVATKRAKDLLRPLQHRSVLQAMGNSRNSLFNLHALTIQAGDSLGHDAVTLDLSVERRGLEPQQFGGARLAAGRPAQRRAN